MASVIGTQQRPLDGAEPMTVARGFMMDGRTPSGGQGVWWRSGRFWKWDGSRWRVREVGKMENEVWRWAENAWYTLRMSSQEVVVKRLVPDRAMVANVVRAMEAASEWEGDTGPTWLAGGGEGMDPGLCVGFEDVVVCVEGGRFRTVKRDERWFDVVTVPARWEEGAKCERWERAVEEWGEGDPQWSELLRRWMGYCLVGSRRWAKWMLMQGESRAGKGVIADVMRRMVGADAWFGTSVGDLGGEFGLDGIEEARVMSIAEFSRGEEGVGEKVARVMKNVVGEDVVTVNVKFERQRRMMVRAAPMIQANMIPKLPNQGQGLSTKMLVLPFTKSWAGREEFGLRERLMGEMAGIAAWAMEGARRLEETGGRVWPRPTQAVEVEKRFRTEHNPLEAFLEARCVAQAGGFVPGSVLWHAWCDWVQVNGLRVSVPRNKLMERLETETTWRVKRHRKRVTRDGGEELVRGLAGVGLLKVVDED